MRRAAARCPLEATMRLAVGEKSERGYLSLPSSCTGMSWMGGQETVR